MLLSELLDEFIIYNKATNKAKKTISKRQSQINRFIEFVPCDHLEQVTSHHVRQFVLALQEEHLAHTYINTFIKSLKAFYVYCESELYIEPRQNIMKRITLLKDVHKKVPVFTESDIVEMLKYKHKKRFLTHRNRLIIMLLIETGMRASELTNIKLENIDGENILITNPKNKRQRVVLLSDITILRLHQYLKLRKKQLKKINKQNDYLIISTYGKGISAGTLLSIITHIVEQVNLNTLARASPHTFRHTFAHQQLEQGVSIYEISRMLGHATVRQTETYIQTVNDLKIFQKHRNNTPITRIYWRK